jgi:23S rRNA (guanosine2251-2'-O)-methyltransferase
MRKLQNEELNRISVEEFKNKKKNPFVLVLDNVRSMHNVGSAFRTADAFMVEKMYLCGITGTPPHREITKTALGATESVEWEHAPDTVQLVARLRSEGWTLVAVEQADESKLLTRFQPDSQQKFGNEVFGVGDEVVALSDICLEIPQYGTKHSLNIAVSIGIICWDYITKTQC